MAYSSLSGRVPAIFGIFDSSSALWMGSRIPSLSGTMNARESEGSHSFLKVRQKRVSESYGSGSGFPARRTSSLMTKKPVPRRSAT